MTADKSNTTAPGYWLNWRFLLCAIWILTAIVVSAAVIWRYEDFNKSKRRQRQDQQLKVGPYHKYEAWSTCSRTIHPVWLLTYRIIAFGILLVLLTADAVVHSGGIFFFYTQWTFTLVTIYFLLGSSLSVYGCLHRCHKDSSEQANHPESDAEHGYYVAPPLGSGTENGDSASTQGNLDTEMESQASGPAFIWCCAFQIIFQVCGGAAVLTDSVFWLIIYPFLTAKDYRLQFLVVCMHSVNAVMLLGDVALNCLRFPFFRITYFALWTCVFVVFQWIFHAFKSTWWPYPFLDLSSPHAPLWYLGIGLLLLPCYGIFALIVKAKEFCLRKITDSHGELN